MNPEAGEISPHSVSCPGMELLKSLRISRRRNPKLARHLLAASRILGDLARLRDIKRDDASRITQRQRQAGFVGMANDQIRSVGIRGGQRNQSSQSSSRLLPMLDQRGPASFVLQDAVEDTLR